MSLYRRDEKQIYTFWFFTAGDIVSVTMLLGVAFLLAFVQNHSNEGIVVEFALSVSSFFSGEIISILKFSLI